MISMLFWDVKQRMVVVPYRRFGTAHRVPCSRFKKSFLPFFYFLTLEVVPMGCPETSIRNYHCSLRNISKEGRSHILRGGSLRSHILEYDSAGVGKLLVVLCRSNVAKSLSVPTHPSSPYFIYNNHWNTLTWSYWKFRFEGVQLQE